MRSVVKRLIDLVAGIVGSTVTSPIVVLLVLAARRDTSASGLFRQVRVGSAGEPFTVVKIRTMRAAVDESSTVTVSGDVRITPLGSRMRRWKLDELPQLWNVAAGQMSLVGPRPDVPGYADQLTGVDRALLELRPGITGPATLVFRREEILLSQVADPELFNDQVIWPAKVAINRAYAEHGSVIDDLRIIWLTLRPDEQALHEMLRRWDPKLIELDVVVSTLELEAAGDWVRTR